MGFILGMQRWFSAGKAKKFYICLEPKKKNHMIISMYLEKHLEMSMLIHG